MIEIEIEGRGSSSPRLRGSATGQTCPDLLWLRGGLAGVIGVTPEVPEQDPDQTCLVVPADLIYDALVAQLRP